MEIRKRIVVICLFKGEQFYLRATNKGKSISWRNSVDEATLFGGHSPETIMRYQIPKIEPTKDGFGMHLTTQEIWLNENTSK